MIKKEWFDIMASYCGISTLRTLWTMMEFQPWMVDDAPYWAQAVRQSGIIKQWSAVLDPYAKFIVTTTCRIAMFRTMTAYKKTHTEANYIVANYISPDVIGRPVFMQQPQFRKTSPQLLIWDLNMVVAIMDRFLYIKTNKFVYHGRYNMELFRGVWSIVPRGQGMIMRGPTMITHAMFIDGKSVTYLAKCDETIYDIQLPTDKPFYLTIYGDEHCVETLDDDKYTYERRYMLMDGEHSGEILFGVRSMFRFYEIDGFVSMGITDGMGVITDIIHMNPRIKQCIEEGLCTSTYGGANHFVQPSYVYGGSNYCESCAMNLTDQERHMEYVISACGQDVKKI